MRKLFFLALFALLSTNLLAQNKNAGVIDSLIELGISMHDDNKFSEAINRYEMALDIDKKSMRAHYELANTLVAVGRFDDAIKHIDVVIKADKQYVDQAYTLKGTAYDLLNEPQKAIKTYRKGIEHSPDSYLLWFNLAVTLLKNKSYEEAGEAAERAVKINASHPGSNLMLGYAHYFLDNPTQSLLPLYHFLILENDSKRAGVALGVINETLGIGVKKDKDEPLNIAVSEGVFSQADMLVGVLRVAHMSMPDSLNADPLRLLITSNEAFFEALGDVKVEKNDGAYFYIELFKALHAAGHTEAFTYWISMAGDQSAASTWLSENKAKLEAFGDWYNTYRKNN